MDTKGAVERAAALPKQALEAMSDAVRKRPARKKRSSRKKSACAVG